MDGEKQSLEFRFLIPEIWALSNVVTATLISTVAKKQIPDGETEGEVWEAWENSRLIN